MTTKAARRTRGRPRLNPQGTKEVLFSIRLSAQEHAEIVVAAARGHQLPSAWARNILLTAARVVMGPGSTR